MTIKQRTTAWYMLAFSKATDKTHTHDIYAKLGAYTRDGLIELV